MGKEPPRDVACCRKRSASVGRAIRLVTSTRTWTITSAGSPSANVASAEVKLPRLKSVDEYDLDNRAQLESTFGNGGFGVSIVRGDDVIFPGLANSKVDTCGRTATLRVPLHTRSGRVRANKRSFVIATASSHGRTDKDSLKLMCRPSTCGNGAIEADHENCDDGNRVSGDGCDQGCHAE
jgi:cysteine-rich repeat protein